ncbi:NUDIX hydrolase [Pseudobutyrivibrio sp. YE44]|uniref:NUDIX hydrolase n=1 Tax=Pseudobutyrivibrio sp. YE44 TaxID=1520802 RepID=UPI000B83EF99|nr:NUDIX domain-containing protein [Pseudobutyrivibrio sp. YE44]
MGKLTELFSKPAAGGIIEKIVDGEVFILLQGRCKGNSREDGLIEIPAGKIREFENIYDCLRREIYEETGLEVTYIQGEEESVLVEHNGYKVLNYTPFSCSQNVEGEYPIMVQVFICRASGKEVDESNESKNLRWVSLNKLRDMLKDEEAFYPMHVSTLKKYLSSKR